MVRFFCSFIFLFLAFLLHSQWSSESLELKTTEDGALEMELDENTIRWEYFESREGLVIYFSPDLGLKMAFPERGGLSYLHREGEWFPFVPVNRISEELTLEPSMENSP